MERLASQKLVQLDQNVSRRETGEIISLQFELVSTIAPNHKYKLKSSSLMQFPIKFIDK